MTKVAIIGFGQQGQECYDLIKDVVQIVDLVDPRFSKKDELKSPDDFLGDTHADVNGLFSKNAYDVGILCVPHAAHTETAIRLIENGRPIIKEKPFAPTINEATTLLKKIDKTGVPVLTVCQRSTSQLFVAAKAMLQSIGTPYAYVYRYFLSQPKTTGWRQSKQIALGGVMLDMGYHIVDVTRNFFGSPSEVACASAFATEQMRNEGLEDYSSAQLFYRERGLVGNIILGRHYHQKMEHFEIFGTNGSIVVEPKKALRCSGLFSGEGHLICDQEKGADLYRKQMIDYLEKIHDPEFARRNVLDHYKNVAILDRIYRSGEENGCYRPIIRPSVKQEQQPSV